MLARHDDPEFRMTFVGERMGQFSREQGLRFDQDDLLLFMGEFLDIRPGEDRILGLNRQLEALLGKTADGRKYIKAHRLTGITRALGDSTATALFGRRHYLSIEIKHLEQLLFKRLQQLTAGDPRCRFVFKKRDAEKAPLGAVADIAADGAVTLTTYERDQREDKRDDVDGEVYIERVAEVMHPDALFALDGVHSATGGIVAHVNSKLPRDEKIALDDEAPEALLHSAHSVGTYDTTGVLDVFLSFNYSDDRLSLPQPDYGPIVQPSLADFHALGWREPYLPIARIIPLKKGLYIGVQTPVSILEIDDAALKRERIAQWHKLVLRRVMPEALLDDLSVKGVEAKRKDDPSKVLENRTRRGLRERLRILGFDIVFAPGIKEPTFDLGEKMLFIPGGDAFNGHTINYQTAQGALKALQGALALKQALGVATTKEAFKELYTERMLALKAEKAESNRVYTEQERLTKQRAEGEIRRDLRGAIGLSDLSDSELRRDFPYLTPTIINEGGVNHFGQTIMASPMQWAVELGRHAVVQHLLTRGGNVTVGAQGLHMFYVAVVSRRWTVEQLHDVFGTPTPAMLYQTNVAGIPLVTAVVMLDDHIDMLRYLLDQADACRGVEPWREELHAQRAPYQAVRTQSTLPVDLLRRLSVTDDLEKYVAERVSPSFLLALQDQFHSATTDVQWLVFNYLKARTEAAPTCLQQMFEQSHAHSPGLAWLDSVLARGATEGQVLTRGATEGQVLTRRAVKAFLDAAMPPEVKEAVIRRNKVFFEAYVAKNRVRSPLLALVVLGFLTEVPVALPSRGCGCLPMLCGGGAAKLAAKRQQVESLRHNAHRLRASDLTGLIEALIDIAPTTALAKQLKTWPQLKPVRAAGRVRGVSSL